MASSYSQTITGLTPGTAYNFQVFAFNSAGNGPVSSPSVSKTTLAASAAITVLDARVQNPPQSFTDAGGTVWTISLMCQCVANGVVDNSTSRVLKMALVNGIAWQGTGTSGGASGTWFSRSGSTWVAGPNPLPAGLAMRSADHLRTWGYNIHYDYMTGRGLNPGPLLVSAFTYLNSTLARAESFGNMGAAQNAAANTLQNGVPGFRHSWLTINQQTQVDGSADPGWMNTQIAATGATAIFGWESVNEPINFRPSDTAQTLLNINAGVGAALRTIPSQNGAPVINLSNSGQGAAAINIYNTMGDQTSRGINWGCWHGYANDGTPAGAQETIQSCIPQAIACAAVSNPGRPWCMTEWGWEITTGAPTANNIATPLAGSKMTVNGFLDCYYYGAAAAFWFEMFEDTGEGFRLFSDTAVPNTYATSIHNFTTLVLDTGATKSTFIPTTLAYSISGGTNYRQTLMQTSNLVFWLALWNTDPVQSSGGSPVDITPTQVNLTITLSQAITSAATYDPIIVGLNPVTSFGAGTTSIPISIGGYAKLIKIVAA